MPSSPSLNLKLPPTATWDALEVASAWMVGGAGTGDNATTGLWVRVEPLGTGGVAPPPALATRSRDAGSAERRACRKSMRC